jgi:hypothetical protein
MPTVYTADIAKGISFEQFAMTCARAFGALIEMRAEPIDKPIPDAFEPNDYHARAKEAAQKKLRDINQLSDEDVFAEATKERQQENESQRNQIRKANELREKYTAMRNEVLAWEPPTPGHVELKQFMLQQIDESIRFDCTITHNEFKKMHFVSETPEPIDGKEWRARKIGELRKAIAYHAKGHAEEIERVNSRNAWVSALRDSLSIESNA